MSFLNSQQEFLTPEDALAHFGVKGMKWGVRKERESGSSSSGKRDANGEPKGPFWTPERKQTAKKVAIGTGALVAVAGTAFVTYKLGQSGKLPISALNKKAPVSHISPKAAPAVKKILAEQTDIIHNSRGKHVGHIFLKKGGTPDFFTEWENAFVKTGTDFNTSDHFEKLPSGKIAAAFKDPLGRTDAAGRINSHQVIIPKSMTEGINSKEDVVKKIWPKLKNTYDAFSEVASKPEWERTPEDVEAIRKFKVS